MSDNAIYFGNELFYLKPCSGILINSFEVYDTNGWYLCTFDNKLRKVFCCVDYRDDWFNNALYIVEFLLLYGYKLG